MIKILIWSIISAGAFIIIMSLRDCIKIVKKENVSNGVLVTLDSEPINKVFNTKYQNIKLLINPSKCINSSSPMDSIPEYKISTDPR